METSVVTNHQNNTGSTGVVNPKILGKDDFFKLLITELRYQDPLEPMKDRDFIAQMANFSSLEQMQNMNKNLESFTTALTGMTTGLMNMAGMQQAVSLIGKEVEFKADSGTASGVVESVAVEDGVPFLMVDGCKVDLKQVLAVRVPPPVSQNPVAGTEAPAGPAGEST